MKPLQSCVTANSRLINKHSALFTQVQNTENGKTVKYLMNICDKVKTSTPGCGSTSICKVDGAKGFQYGSVGSGTFTKLDGDLQMYFRNGDTCQGSFILLKKI